MDISAESLASLRFLGTVFSSAQLLLFAYLAVSFFSNKKSVQTLVLRKFNIDEKAESGFFVEIIGRTSGLKAWLLTILGFDTESSLRFDSKKIEYRNSSLFGEELNISPLASISSTLCGYTRPVFSLIAGIFSSITFLICTLAYADASRYEKDAFLIIIYISLILAVIFLVRYALNKKLTISVQTSGKINFGLSFKRSVMENVAVNISEVRRAIFLLNSKVVEAQSSHIEINNSNDNNEKIIGASEDSADKVNHFHLKIREYAQAKKRNDIEQKQIHLHELKALWNSFPGEMKSDLEKIYPNIRGAILQ